MRTIQKTGIVGTGVLFLIHPIGTFVANIILDEQGISELVTGLVVGFIFLILFAFHIIIHLVLQIYSPHERFDALALSMTICMSVFYGFLIFRVLPKDLEDSLGLLMIVVFPVFLLIIEVSYFIISHKRRKIYSEKIERKKLTLFFLIESILLVGIAVYLGLFSHQCRVLDTQGFGYKMTGGRSPTWDTIDFFFRPPEGKNVRGPMIAGSCLKIRCRDVNGDGVAEFIISSTITETYQTILMIDLETGSYHVYSTEGLKVSYPKEGYYYH